MSDPTDQSIILEECWADEPCIRLRVEDGPNGRRIVSIIDTSDGWPGTVVARATLASFRTARIAAAISTESGR